MAKKENTTSIGFEDAIRRAAAKLLWLPLALFLPALAGCGKEYPYPLSDETATTRADSIAVADSLDLGLVIEIDTAWAGHIYRQF
jgi:hypothetical protein